MCVAAGGRSLFVLPFVGDERKPARAGGGAPFARFGSQSQLDALELDHVIVVVRIIIAIVKDGIIGRGASGKQERRGDGSKAAAERAERRQSRSFLSSGRVLPHRHTDTHRRTRSIDHTPTTRH